MVSVSALHNRCKRRQRGAGQFVFVLTACSRNSLPVCDVFEAHLVQQAACFSRAPR